MGILPSFAMAWNVDQEDFSGYIFDSLKLRLGYGQVKMLMVWVITNS